MHFECINRNGAANAGSSPVRGSNKNKMKKVHNVFGPIINFGERYLKFIFFKRHILDGHFVYLPRWITKEKYEMAEKDAEELFEKTKWE